MEYILLASGWIAYYALHSLLAANPVKRWIKEQSQSVYNNYRILYNLTAVAGLVLLIYLTLQHPVLLFAQGKFTFFSGLVFTAAGMYILILSFMTFDLKEFLGIKSSGTTSLNNGQLIVSGIYQYVRHPLYFGIILLGLGLFLILPTIKIALSVAVMYGYILAGSKLEEQKLIEEFGNQYVEYARKVKGLIPFIF
jgi:methanethiol S-methyltransferase